ncbi:hypothetical protein BGZ80_007628 [Entomortierella chlamydospora]|uniref:Uncharacterized protein n=1 Tax=Entomortierella chlamydospora TaxID=101097 RepID=A0A9P6MYY9_9FUNG|nr:hypothetical protein BGZ80_007628 [Entomortierella chlamydospora]
MPASYVAPTMACSRPIATDTAAHMKDTGHAGLDDTESDDELQKLNQDITWEYNGIGIVKKFNEFHSHYFVFHDELPRDLNEREAFVGFSWAFIRGALAMAKIETRYLEVLITDVDERKNHDKGLRFDTKEAGQFADGIGFRGVSQIYLAEASVLHQPKAENLLEDDFKLVRAMMDSWESHLS